MSIRQTLIRVLKGALQYLEKQPVKAQPKTISLIKDQELVAPIKTEVKTESITDFLRSLNTNNDKDLHTLFTNIERDFNRPQPDSTSSNYQNIVKNIVAPVVKTWWDGLTIRQIIGVQPMSGPVGQIHTLRQGHNGTSATIQVLKEVVESKTRKISARWTFEAAWDGIPNEMAYKIEEEIRNALAQEFLCETEYALINELKEIALQSSEISFKDFHKEVETISADMAARNRRGLVNWMIINMRSFSYLAHDGKFIKASPSTKKVKGCLEHVGTYNDIEVYVDSFANNDYMILGYNGKGNMDSGFIYCPYVPLTTAGVVIDPTTFEPVVSFMSRFGTFIAQNARDYYTYVPIKFE